MIKAALAVYWAQIDSALHKYRWAGAELVMRGLTTLFLMYLFLKVNPRALPLRNPQVKINHFLVPVLMFGITANFAACLVDQQLGSLDRILRYCNQSLARIPLSYSSPSPIPHPYPPPKWGFFILTPKINISFVENNSNALIKQVFYYCTILAQPCFLDSLFTLV